LDIAIAPGSGPPRLLPHRAARRTYRPIVQIHTLPRERRHGSLADWLRGREHVASAFSAADILVTSVLRMVRHTELVAESPVLASYQARCESRVAFQRALQDHMAAFAKQDVGG
jgi:hypothetical protein